MLQIISGKYFDQNKKINTQTEFDVLYSNFHWFLPIKTKYFEINPIHSYPGKINQFVVKYENKYQPRDDTDVLVLASHDPVIHQIKYLLTFYFDCFFHRDKNVVVQFISNQLNPNIKDNIANIHLPHIFKPKDKDLKFDIDGFISFVDTVIGFNRNAFSLLMKYLNAYYNALESFETNYEISYTTLIYLLEALISDISDYSPVWDDFDEGKRSKLDKVFSNIEDIYSDEIKDILLKDSNLKLKRNFVKGLYNYTKDIYYKKTTLYESRKIHRSEMFHVLSNLYQIRSKYVHKLDSLETVVKTHGFNKTNHIYDFDNPKFSIFGLSIFTKHIIENFIANPLEDNDDEYNWRNDLPGIIMAKLSPEYWIATSEGFKKEYAYAKFNGFFELLSQNKFINIKELLKVYEKMFDNVNPTDFASMFTVYCVYNFLVNEESQVLNFMNTLERHSSKIEKCLIQYLVMGFFVKGLPIWTSAEQEECLNKYFSKKFKLHNINLPKSIEVLIICNIANNYLSEGNMEKYTDMLNMAKFEAINIEKQYKYLEKIKDGQEIDLSQIGYTI